MAGIAEESKCQYNYLGKSGTRVSNICLGALTFGDHVWGIPNQLDEEGAIQVLNRFVEWGGNFIDTAEVYGPHNSEKIIGSWLSTQERDKFVIATKAFAKIFGPSPDPNNMGVSRRHIVRAIEGSLERLKTDYVDLYQIHFWDAATPLEETLRTLDDLVRCGKVRYLGASNFTGWQLQKLVQTTAAMGLNPFVSLQQQYSLVERHSELEPFQVCQLNGVGVLAWSPLKGGVLTGKYKRGEAPAADGRVGWVGNDASRENVAFPSQSTVEKMPRIWELLDTMKSIADKKGKSVAQVALRWVLQRPVVTSAIIGVSNLRQLDDNMGAANGWTLSEEEMSKLEELTKVQLFYPYDMIWQVNGPRQNPWNPAGWAY